MSGNEDVPTIAATLDPPSAAQEIESWKIPMNPKISGKIENRRGPGRPLLLWEHLQIQVSSGVLYHQPIIRAVGSLVVRASDSRPEGLGLDARCHQIPSECTRISCRSCGGEIEVVSPSIDPSENFTELNRTVTCMVLKANDRRTSSPLPRGISWASI
ncbi:hypothetical protein TNCV_203421 [Trichonephila clavipes]|nr:hypothetical protein TNCV_203421 [Trichonephila clavipes]